MFRCADNCYKTVVTATGHVVSLHHWWETLPRSCVHCSSIAAPSLGIFFAPQQNVKVAFMQNVSPLLDFTCTVLQVRLGQGGGPTRISLSAYADASLNQETARTMGVEGETLGGRWDGGSGRSNGSWAIAVRGKDPWLIGIRLLWMLLVYSFAVSWFGFWWRSLFQAYSACQNLFSSGFSSHHFSSGESTFYKDSVYLEMQLGARNNLRSGHNFPAAVEETRPAQGLWA